jgi:hypothetical protein
MSSNADAFGLVVPMPAAPVAGKVLVCAVAPTVITTAIKNRIVFINIFLIIINLVSLKDECNKNLNGILEIRKS